MMFYVHRTTISMYLVMICLFVCLCDGV